MARLAQRVLDAAERVASGRAWAWRVGLAALVLSAVHALPAYDAIDRSGVTETVRLKGLHPFTHFGTGAPASHEAKLDFRFIAPLALRPFHAAFVAMVLLYALCGIAVYALLSREIARAGIPRRTAALSAFGVAVTAAGGTFLLGYQYFDGLAIALAMVATVATRGFPLSVVVALLALYTDERAAIALVLGVASSKFIDGRATQPARRMGWSGLVGVFVLYAVSRIVLDAATALRSETAEVGLSAVRANGYRIPIGVAFAFAAWWLVFGVGMFRLIQNRKYLLPGLGVAALWSAVLVDDVTRSLSYLLPLAPAAVVALSDRQTKEKLDRTMLAAFVACALTPALVMIGAIGHFNPLPFQLGRHLLAG